LKAQALLKQTKIVYPSLSGDGDPFLMICDREQGRL
jgi:hypothetical protein